MGVFHNGDYYARAMHPLDFTFEMCFLQLEEELDYMARFLHSIRCNIQCSSLTIAQKSDTF